MALGRRTLLLWGVGPADRPSVLGVVTDTGTTPASALPMTTHDGLRALKVTLVVLAVCAVGWVMFYALGYAVWSVLTN